jgi:hypothetical protein
MTGRILPSSADDDGDDDDKGKEKEEDTSSLLFCVDDHGRFKVLWVGQLERMVRVLMLPLGFSRSRNNNGNEVVARWLGRDYVARNDKEENEHMVNLSSRNGTKGNVNDNNLHHSLGDYKSDYDDDNNGGKRERWEMGLHCSLGAFDSKSQ